MLQAERLETLGTLQLLVSAEEASLMSVIGGPLVTVIKPESWSRKLRGR